MLHFILFLKANVIFKFPLLNKYCWVFLTWTGAKAAAARYDFGLISFLEWTCYWALQMYRYFFWFWLIFADQPSAISLNTFFIDQAYFLGLASACYFSTIRTYYLGDLH